MFTFKLQYFFFKLTWNHKPHSHKTRQTIVRNVNNCSYQNYAIIYFKNKTGREPEIVRVGKWVNLSRIAWAWFLLHLLYFLYKRSYLNSIFNELAQIHLSTIIEIVEEYFTIFNQPTPKLESTIKSIIRWLSIKIEKKNSDRIFLQSNLRTHCKKMYVFLYALHIPHRWKPLFWRGGGEAECL